MDNLNHNNKFSICCQSQPHDIFQTTNNMRRAIAIIIGVLATWSAHATGRDTTSLCRYGLEFGAQPGWVIAADPYEKKWLKGNFAMAVNASIRYSALPCDSDAYARDFGYPVLA
jgi:hypothetical protein